MCLVTDIADGSSAKAKKAVRFGITLVPLSYVSDCVTAKALLATDAFALTK